MSPPERPRGKGFRRSEAPRTPDEERLDAALAALEELVDWERRDRASGSTRLMKVSVEPARDLLDRLGRPDAALRVVHVAGTKGKGSVSSIVAEALRTAGHPCGLFTSPHVERVNERIAVDGRAIADGELAALLEEVLGARETARAEGGAAADATWFDVMTAAAALAFARAQLPWAVFECGLGGRLDSTNALHGEVCVLTNVDLEHTAILGTTRAAIAREKVGILEPGATLVTGLATDDEAGRVVDERAAELGCRVRRVPDRGPFAARNAGIAGEVLNVLGESGLVDVSGRAVGGHLLDERLLEAARLPARCERRTFRGIPVVLDGAHVASSLEALLEELRGHEDLSGPAVAIFGCGREKDAAGLLKVLLGGVDRVLCVSTGTGPQAPPEELAATAAGLGGRAETARTPEVALEQAVREVAPSGWILITGSLHLAGRLRQSLRDPCTSC